MNSNVASLATAAGLLSAGTAVAGAFAASLPLMGVAVVGGLAATATALCEKSQHASDRPTQMTASERSQSTQQRS